MLWPGFKRPVFAAAGTPPSLGDAPPGASLARRSILKIIWPFHIVAYHSYTLLHSSTAEYSTKQHAFLIDHRSVCAARRLRLRPRQALGHPGGQEGRVLEED